MEKNTNLKNDPYYSKSHLRQKIEESIKRQRDETCEVKETPMKVLQGEWGDANHDSENLVKNFRNKTLTD